MLGGQMFYLGRVAKSSFIILSNIW